MAERLHLLNQRPMVFEGQPSPYRRRDSLPPAAEPYKPVYVDIPPMHADDSAEREYQRPKKLRPKRAQADRNAVFNGSSADELHEHVARANDRNRSRAAVARVPVAEAGFAAPAPAPSPVPMPASLPAVPLSLPRREAPRTHVLDWKSRMDGYSYTVAPDGVLPKKSKHANGRRGLTHQQLNEAFYSSPASGEINAKPQAQQRQRIRAHPSTNPFSEG
jgi:hypothetical protein